MPPKPPTPKDPTAPASNAPRSPRSGASFRRRYDELERQREALIARLANLNKAAQMHPGYRRAMKLLNETFRKSTLAQRIGVLQAASWLLDVIERLALTM